MHAGGRVFSLSHYYYKSIKQVHRCTKMYKTQMYSCTKMYTSAFTAKSGLATAIPTNTSTPTMCVLKINKSLN